MCTKILETQDLSVQMVKWGIKVRMCNDASYTLNFSSFQMLIRPTVPHY